MYFNTHHLSQINKAGNPLVADRNVLITLKIILMVEICSGDGQALVPIIFKIMISLEQ